MPNYTFLLLLPLFAVAFIPVKWNGDDSGRSSDNGFQAYEEQIPGSEQQIRMVPVPRSA
ncbi:MAG: hypothetical protein R3324_11875 [Halobacteriales archaeon]|nr:hypothetical protein [Halobacteriales archaeon]